ncbi:MAG: class I SAM-dependent rRNA methyltransferase [Thalassobaculales bacterium]
MTAITTRFLEAAPWPGYALVDIGGGRKLERFGRVLVDRPEPQALWRRGAAERWAAADLRFEAAEDDEKGAWSTRAGMPRDWSVPYEGLAIACRATSFRHVGIFPEQAPHWAWLAETLAAARQPSVLNLFGYTGVASLVAARAGASVTHVDASKKAIAWARENQAASGLEGLPIRWICDDASAFVAREVRRGRRYDAIILDPPTYGRGPGGEVWRLFEDLPRLLEGCAHLLAERPLFVLLSVYALRLSFLSVAELLADLDHPAAAAIEAGELVVRAETGGRRFATSLYARWSTLG